MQRLHHIGLRLAALAVAAACGCGGSSAGPAPAPSQAPLARLRLPHFGDPGAQLLFDAGDAESPGGAILHWCFGFGDGAALLDAGVPRVHHAYAAEGIYAVSLEIEDLLGRKARVQAQVTVRVGAPVCVSDTDCAVADLCREARCTTEVGSTDR